jgi:hypothetical protein
MMKPPNPPPSPYTLQRFMLECTIREMLRQQALRKATTGRRRTFAEMLEDCKSPPGERPR